MHIYCFPDGPELDEPTSRSFATLLEDNVTLICGTNLVGNPEPIVHWLSNTGNEVSPNDKSFSISNGSQVVSLTIFNANLSSAGNWSCILSLNAPNGSTIQQQQRNLILTIVGEYITAAVFSPGFDSQSTCTLNLTSLGFICNHTLTVEISLLLQLPKGISALSSMALTKGHYMHALWKTPK